MFWLTIHFGSLTLVESKLFNDTIQSLLALQQLPKYEGRDNEADKID